MCWSCEGYQSRAALTQLINTPPTPVIRRLTPIIPIRSTTQRESFLLRFASEKSSKTVDMSVPRSVDEPEVAGLYMDEAVLHQPLPRRKHSRIAYSQEAAHGLIGDYLTSGDALLIQEGECMRAAEEGKVLVGGRPGRVQAVSYTHL